MSSGASLPRPSGLRAPSVSASTRSSALTTSSSSGSKLLTASATSLSNSTGAILTEDTDGFIIGDRVWVGGTKAGVIQYIGETQFAPGEWAGVVLDEPVGKNNGSLAGVQYFQCEPKRGVFSRLTKLTREPVASLVLAERQHQATLDVENRANGSVRSASPARSLTRSSTPGSNDYTSFRVGDRVQVTTAVGLKNGTLRYMGTTNFAPGEWAGIELDNATGKNDGAVEGTRYFNCPMKYGLFAPVHKVTKPGFSSARRNLAATISSTTPRRSTTMLSSPKRIGSHESISTIGSASKVTATRGPRLGVNSLTSSATKPSRSSAVSVTATHTAMQEALKEKEQHIEQLMKERDMERAEVVRAAAQVDEAERELAAAKTSFQKRIEEDEANAAKMREAIAEADKRTNQLQNRLDEEKKKVEDLQFRFEEENISKSDLENTATNFEGVKELDAARIRELEELLNAERARVEALEHESNLNFQSEEEMLAKHFDEVEELKAKLTQAEDLVKSLEAAKVSAGCQASQAAEELVNARDAKIVELEGVIHSLNASDADASKNLKLLRERLQESENKVAAHETAFMDLNEKVQKLESDLTRNTKRSEELQLENSDLRRSLQATQENYDSVVQQKDKVEAEIIKQMKSSGDNSTQLIKITEELRVKEREVESLRLRDQTARQQSERLEEIVEQLQGQHQRAVEALGTKHWEEIGRLEESVRTAREEADRLRPVRVRLEAERAETLKDHEAQLAEWRGKYQEQSNQVEALAAKLEDALKTGEDGRRVVEELKSTMERKVMEVLADKEAAIKEKSELAGVRSALERDKSELEGQVKRLESERGQHVNAVGERDAKLGVLNAEVDRLRAEFNRHRDELQRQLAETTIDQDVVFNMRSHLEQQQRNLDETEERLRLAEEDKLRLQEKLARAEADVVVDKQKLESKISTLEKQLEDSRTSVSQWQSSHEDEKETLQKMLQATQSLLEQREQEVSSLQEQMSVKNADALVEAKRLREEKARLETQLAEARAATPVVDGNLTTSDLALQKLIEDKEAYEGQIEFLNSVIVDMQRKNDDLASRINVLEMGDMLHGSSDVNLNAINASSAIPPRMFCDICDAFDQHDTEDCPKQEASDGPPATQYHGTRHQERPYCDICEVFGHWTNECDDNETF